MTRSVKGLRGIQESLCYLTANKPDAILKDVAKYCGMLLITTHKYALKKGKGSPHSITKRRVPQLIPILGSQPAGDVNHKPDGRLPILSARPAVTPTTLKRAATNFAAW